MKVLFVVSANKEFGMSPFVKSQGESLVNNGVNIDYYLIDKGGIKGYLSHIKLLKEKIKSNSYNVIHAHYTYSGWVSLLTNTKTPKLVSFMGADVYGSVNANGKKNIKAYFNYTLSKLIQPFIGHIIAKSKHLQSYIYIKKKSSVIPNGVNFKKYKIIPQEEARNTLNINPIKKQILFLGNKKNPRKNYKLLEKAFEVIKDENVELMDINYPIKPDLVPTYINASDVVILTSYLEGSPNVIKEAMACSCPIVSVDVGDVKEVISNTKGCYISKYEYKDLADKILKAITFKGKTTGRVDVKHLEINNIAKKIINIYDDLQNKK
jgi:teichuronic acid biosynthesis glycosyltransferase TuaC